MPRPEPQPIGVEGANCDRSPCNPGLACTPTTRRCAKPDDPEIVAAKLAELERERAFLAQSGVGEHPPHLEQPVPTPPPTAEAPPAASGAVRVVRISNEGKTSWVFAACRADERLVGGGCNREAGNWLSVPGHPSGESATDTLGARWNCGWKGGRTDVFVIEAFALCQRL